MFRHDLSAWPLVLTVADGAPTLEDLDGFSAAWTQWLDRGESFATLRVLTSEQARKHPPGGGKAREHWFQANGERLKQQVLGMATVAPAALVQQANRADSERLYGVPARSFDDLEQALAWLLPHLHGRFPAFDVRDIETRLQRLRGD